MNVIQQAISSIRNKASEMFNDDKGWIRQGQFAPKQNLQQWGGEIGQRWQQGGGASQFTPASFFKTTAQGASQGLIKPVFGQQVGNMFEQTIQNRITQPIVDVPKNAFGTIQGLGGAINPFNKKTLSERAGSAFGGVMSGLQTLGGLSPLGLEDITMAGYDVAKAKLSGKSGVKAFTGEEFTGLGEVAGRLNAPMPVQSALSYGEIPLLLAGSVASRKIGAKKAGEVAQLLANREKLVKLASQQPNSPSVVKAIKGIDERVAKLQSKGVIPEVGGKKSVYDEVIKLSQDNIKIDSGFGYYDKLPPEPKGARKTVKMIGNSPTANDMIIRTPNGDFQRNNQTMYKKTPVKVLTENVAGGKRYKLVDKTGEVLDTYDGVLPKEEILKILKQKGATFIDEPKLSQSPSIPEVGGNGIPNKYNGDTLINAGYDIQGRLLGEGDWSKGTNQTIPLKELDISKIDQTINKYKSSVREETVRAKAGKRNFLQSEQEKLKMLEDIKRYNMGKSSDISGTVVAKASGSSPQSGDFSLSQSPSIPEVGGMNSKTFIHETNASNIDKFDANHIGTGQGDGWLGRGVYFNEKGSFKLEKYGKNSIETSLKPEAKIFDVKETPNGKWRDSFVEWFAKRNPDFEKSLEPWQNPKNVLPRDLLMNRTADDEVIKLLRKEGYDGLFQDGELVVYNPNVVKIIKSQSPSIPEVKRLKIRTPEQVNSRLKIKPEQLDNPQTGVVKPTDLQTNLPPVVKQSIKQIDQAKSKLNLGEVPVTSTLDGSIPRKFTTSIQDAPNIAGETKAGVSSLYTPKAKEQLMGEAKALLESGATIDFKNTQGLDKKVAATIQEAINQQNAGNHEAAANLFNNLSEHGTELGRSVQAFNLLQKMSPQAIALSAAGKIKKYNLANPRRPIPKLNGDQVKMIADKVQEVDLLKGREKNIALNELGNMVNDFIPSTLADKAITIWKAGLLTSFRTHERNFVGNAIHGLTETLKDIPASLADMALSGRTGKRSMTFTTRGLGEFGSKSTRQQMADIFQKGFDPSQTIDKFDYKQITWGKNPIEQTLKKYTDIVFRSLGASDKPFYNASMARSLYDQAGAEAINSGRRGDMSFIENLVKNPTEQMVKTAINDANVATFKTKNAASEVANTIKRVLGKNEWSKLAGEVTLPFTGVPSSIAGQIINYSPIGLIKGIYKVGDVAINKLPELQRQAVQEMGRGVIGTGIFALGAYLMGKGIITGQPKDAEEARLWDSQNKPRNSIMINGKWRSLNSIGPESVVFLAGAKLNEEMNDPEGGAGQYAMSLGKDYLDQSFVQGLQGPVNAITDPARYGKSYAGQLASSPIPNIVKDVARGFDPTQRESNTVMDYVKSGIPGVRNTMIEKRDVLGNVMAQEPTGLAAGLDLFNSKTPISSPVVDELARLYAGGTGATPSKLTPSQTILKQKVKLTYDQLNNMEAGVGDILRPRLEQLMMDPNYQKLSDEEKSSIIDKVVQDTRLKYKNANAGQFGVAPKGGYIDSTGAFKQVDTTPIKPPQLTGNSTIDKKLMASYKTDVANQATNLAKSTQPTTTSDTSKVYSYVDENGAYKTVDLTPPKYPTMTGNSIVDKKLKSAYYSSLNSQINDVIKLGQAGQITQEEMIKMVTDINTKSSKGRKGGGRKGKKLKIKAPKKIRIKKLKAMKIKKPKKLKLSFKQTKPIKLKMPRLKFSNVA